MKIVYAPKGPASDYAKLAVNLFSGCRVGCRYCYAPRVLHTSRESFRDHTSPRRDCLVNLEADLIRLHESGVPFPLFFSFACDPYQDRKLMAQALLLCKAYKRPWTILTKLTIPAREHFPQYDLNDSFGTTLTLLDPDRLAYWEPAAERPEDRIESLRIAHDYGIRTWVSLEPVLDPDETLAIISIAHRYVSHWWLGKLNDHPNASNIDWPDYFRRATQLLNKLGAHYSIKRELTNAIGARKQERTEDHETRKILL